jgi:glycosyltransferase involved in cell wall biosynthesis
MNNVPRKKKLLFVVNVDWFFVSHRLPIAIAAAQAGYDVHVAAQLTLDPRQMTRHGITVHAIPMSRSSMSPAQAWESFCALRRLYRTLTPDLVHLITIKPIILGGIAARLTKVPAVLAAVPGLGFVFLARGLRARLNRMLVGFAYRQALDHDNLKIIFQNKEDQQLLGRFARLPSGKCSLIKGSGVDLAAFSPRPRAGGRPVVLMATRLLSDKGVREFVQAARQLRARGVEARFCLAGEPDPGNRASIGADELAAWREEGCIELLGQRSDMAELMGMTSVVALPSYREGLPKVLLEAAACGRAVVTTDVPGCRDAVTPGVTGLLVPVRDATALADALHRLLTDRSLCESMGLAGRQLAEREFSIEQVVTAHLMLYQTLAGNP